MTICVPSPHVTLFDPMRPQPTSRDPPRNLSRPQVLPRSVYLNRLRQVTGFGRLRNTATHNNKLHWFGFSQPYCPITWPDQRGGISRRADPALSQLPGYFCHHCRCSGPESGRLIKKAMNNGKIIIIINVHVAFKGLSYKIETKILSLLRRNRQLNKI